MPLQLRQLTGAIGDELWLSSRCTVAHYVRLAQRSATAVRGLTGRGLRHVSRAAHLRSRGESSAWWQLADR